MNTRIKQLEERRSELLIEMESLKARLEELDGVLAILKGEGRTDLVGTLNRLLDEAGDNGLTVDEAVELGDLNKASAAVALSRMKATGTVVRKDNRYVKVPPASLMKTGERGRGN